MQGSARLGLHPGGAEPCRGRRRRGSHSCLRNQHRCPEPRPREPRVPRPVSKMPTLRPHGDVHQGLLRGAQAACERTTNAATEGGPRTRDSGTPSRPQASRRGGGDARLTGCRAAESLPHAVPARPPNPGALPCRPGEGGCGPVPRRALNSDPRSLSRVAEEGHLTQEDSAALAEQTAGTARRPAQEGKRPPGRNAGAAGRVRGE